MAADGRAEDAPGAPEFRPGRGAASAGIGPRRAIQHNERVLGPVTVDVARRLRDLPDDHLSMFERASAYATARELISMEGPKYGGRHLIVRDAGGVPLATAPLLVLEKSHMTAGDQRELFDVVRDDAAVLLGGIASYANHVMFRTGLTAGERSAAAAALVRGALGVADDHGLPHVMAPHLAPAQAAAFEAVVAERGLRTRVVERAVVDVAWPDFDGYVATLGKKRRWQVRKERSAFAPLRAGVSEEELSGPLYGELAPLLAEVENKYGADHAVEHVGFYLRTVGRAMGEHGRALVLRRDGEVIAFVLVLADPAEWHVRAWGCRYDAVTGEFAEWANLVMYEVLERAAARGVPHVHLGTGSLDAKAFRGSRLEPLTSVELRGAPGQPGLRDTDSSSDGSFASGVHAPGSTPAAATHASISARE